MVEQTLKAVENNIVSTKAITYSVSSIYNDLQLHVNDTDNTVTMYTDGACKMNPGVGGFGVILYYKHHIKELYGHEDHTTNNQMELSAVIAGIMQITKSSKIAIYTDSQYVKRGITEWIETWIAKNWNKVKNQELWQALYYLSKKHQITWNWVKAHNGTPLNERADFLANMGVMHVKSSI